MKTLLKIVLVVVIINAATRAGIAAMRYYQFKDAAQQAVLFGAESSPEDIQQLILQRAQKLNLPVLVDDVQVNREGARTWADASYRQEVELFPNQEYPVDLSFSVESYNIVLGAQPPKK